MHLESVIQAIEGAVDAQLALAGGDPAAESAARSVLVALRPALREAAMELANQAAEEVRAQLPGWRVDLLLVDGDPSLQISEEGVSGGESDDQDFDARITVRLPPSVKALVEEAASEAGDSINSWVVKTISSRSRRARPGRQVRETFDI